MPLPHGAGHNIVLVPSSPRATKFGIGTTTQKVDESPFTKAMSWIFVPLPWSLVILIDPTADACRNRCST